MPNKHAAIKDLRKNRKRAAQNLKIKTNVKSLYKNSVALIKEGKLKEAQELAQRFQQAVDKAVNKHILSKNAASRKKATLMKSANPKK